MKIQIELKDKEIIDYVNRFENKEDFILSILKKHALQYKRLKEKKNEKNTNSL